MDTMTIEREPGSSPDMTIFHLKGPFVLGTMFEFQNTLRDPEVKGVIVDLSEVPYIDSAGLGTILSHWAHTQRSGHKFALTGVSPRIDVLLEMTKVNTVLPMFKTAEDADQSFTGQSAKA